MPACPAQPRRRALISLTLVLLCAGAAAQNAGPPGQGGQGGGGTKESDPRFAKDPTDVPDPRDVADPRVTQKDPYETLTGTELYDALYTSGETGRLKQQFATDGWQILEYIDSHCEGWLALVERGGTAAETGRKEADNLQAKGRALATMADEALGNTRFSFYVSNFYGWTTEQQQLFREGQKLYGQAATLYRDARTPAAALPALTSLRQSLDRARKLDDTWGQSMALAMMGRIHAENAQVTEAQATMKDAVRIGREIRDMDAVWEGLSVLYETALAENSYEPARDALRDQYLLAKEVNDVQTADKVLVQLVELDKAFGREP